MSKRLLAAGVAIIGWALCGGTAVIGAENLTETDDWTERLVQRLSDARFEEGLWGVHVESLKTGETLFSWNSDKLMKPASNAKLFTGALALARLGPDYAVETTIHVNGPIVEGTLNGDLMIYGRGDPSYAARFHGGDYAKSLDALADVISGSGIRHVTGDLVGDESFFEGPPFGAGWEWEDLQYYYGAEVSALTQEDNVIDLVIRPGVAVDFPLTVETRPPTDFLSVNNFGRTGNQGSFSTIEIERLPGQRSFSVFGRLSMGGAPVTSAVTVPNPAAWFLERLRSELRERGVDIEGGDRVISALDRKRDPFDPEAWRVHAVSRGQPMREVVARMMKPSQNLYAQLLFLHAGMKAMAGEGASPQSEWMPPLGEMWEQGNSERIARQALRQFLEEVGIAPEMVLLEDGSGLSRGSLVTPSAVVGLLREMRRRSESETFVNSLPIAGADGTLRRRFRGTVAEGKVRAKTGTLSYVNALSGYVPANDGDEWVFSIMLNHYDPDDGVSGRSEVDETALLIATEALGKP